MKYEVTCVNGSCPSVVEWAPGKFFNHVMLALPGSRCPACGATTAQKLREVPDDNRFPCGLWTVTPGVQDLLAPGEDDDLVEAMRPYVQRHVNGDWGDIPDEDKRLNDVSIGRESKPTERLRLLSVYTTPDGEKIWVITEAGRHQTTILLPEEY